MEREGQLFATIGERPEQRLSEQAPNVFALPAPDTRLTFEADAEGRVAALSNGKRGLAFEPGSRFEYSNYGYVLLGLVIQKASGKSYYDYVRDNVYRRAGMADTGSESEATPVADRSVGYMRTPDGVTSNVDTLPPRPTSAGGGYSTVGDLQRFASALLGHRLLSARYTELLTTGRVDAHGARYAYGFFDTNERGVRWFGHGGGAPGMNGDLRIYPATGHVVAVLANLDPPAAQTIAEFAGVRLPRP